MKIETRAIKTRMNWRLASRLSVITFAILVVIAVTIIQQHNSAGVSNGSGLQGTDLGGTPAPNFRLTDQSGNQVSLEQFKGKPVVLTFLYTHCPDVCPLTAEHLHSTMLELGKDAHNVAVLAVSTDPKRDDVAAAMHFSQQHQMTSYWHYLVGTQQQLSPVWASYSIYAQAQQQNINHSMAIFVIDKQGRERVFLSSNDFTPAQLTADLKILLKE
jgi:protein SCO1/2